MSTIKNGGLDQFGAEPVEQQQFGTAGIEGIKRLVAYVAYWNYETRYQATRPQFSIKIVFAARENVLIDLRVAYVKSRIIISSVIIRVILKWPKYLNKYCKAHCDPATTQLVKSVKSL